MSLRARLTLSSVVVVILALASLGVVSAMVARSALIDRTDQEVAALGTAALIYAPSQLAKIESGQRPLGYKVFDAIEVPSTFTGEIVLIPRDGTHVALPRLAHGPDSPVPVPDDLWARAGAGPFTVDTPDDPYRGLVIAVPGHDAVVFVALSQQPTDEALAHLFVIEGALGTVLLVLFVVLMVAVIRVGLRPLERVTDVARRLAHGDLGVPQGLRVPASPVGTEMGALTEAFNDMLTAVEDSAVARAEAQRRTERFAADAAHELRTPVTAILGYAELYHQGGVIGADRLDEVFERVRGEASRLHDLVESLLVLNRLDQAASETPAVAVDLAVLCADAAADAMTIDGRYPVEVIGHDGVAACGRRDQLFQIVANLLANVRAHTPAGTSTVITLRPDPGDGAGDGPRPPMVQVEVADDGPGIPGADRDHVFERFYRADPSRGRNGRRGGGSGLGLAIVAELARSNGGAVDLVDGPGATIVVTLPGVVGQPPCGCCASSGWATG